MRRRARVPHLLAGWIVLAALAGVPAQAVSVAIVGDSLADAIYLGMKLQPELLRQDHIQLVHWSRSRIGLTRTDYFDYTAWLRDNEELGNADFCVVQLGANDLQSIAIGKNKWISVGSPAWQRAYEERVVALLNTLKPSRCGSVVWLLQPSYERNKFLSHYNQMINAVQLSGSTRGGVPAFEVVTTDSDYSSDGIHFNKPFCFKIGRAVANLFANWESLAGCLACHVSAGSASPLVLRHP